MKTSLTLRQFTRRRLLAAAAAGLAGCGLQFVCGSAATVAAGLSLPRWSAAEGPVGAWSLENQHLKYVIGPDARSLQFINRQTGRDHCGGGGKAALARVKKAGRYYDASSAHFGDGRLSLAFGDSGVQAVLKATVHPQHLVLEVLSVTGFFVRNSVTLRVDV